MTRFATVPVEPSELLPAHATIAAAMRIARGREGFVFGLAADPANPAEPIRAVRAIDLREATQRGLPHAVETLADAALVHTDEASAQRWLELHPTEGAVLVEIAPPQDGSGTPRLVRLERAVPLVTTAVVMAGGRGSRLRPLTDDVPKPLLEVGGRVLLLRIFDRLRQHGVRDVYVSIHHLGDKIRAAIGDGAALGLRVRYLEEDRPLDTGAGLALLRGVDVPFFVINGDILTDLDFSLLGRTHGLSGALATIATYRYPAALPYGVVHRDGHAVTRIEEKPVHRYDVNAGIYVFAPDALGLVRRGEPLAMVDFLNTHAGSAGRVRSFPLIEYWNDIGTHADFERAQTEVHHL